MIVPDSNLLLYAYNPASPFQARAATWWEECLRGVEPVGIPWVVILSFLRISTNPKFPARAAMLESVDAVRSWLSQPNVKILTPGFRHTDIYFEMLARLDATGNLTTDAHIAALCLEHEAVLHSNDSDFDRVSSLKRHNPLA